MLVVEKVSMRTLPMQKKRILLAVAFNSVMKLTIYSQETIDQCCISPSRVCLKSTNKYQCNVKGTLTYNFNV